MTILRYMITLNIFSHPTTSTVLCQRYFRVLKCKATKSSYLIGTGPGMLGL